MKTRWLNVEDETTLEMIVKFSCTGYHDPGDGRDYAPDDQNVATITQIEIEGKPIPVEACVALRPLLQDIVQKRADPAVYGNES